MGGHGKRRPDIWKCVPAWMIHQCGVGSMFIQLHPALRRGSLQLEGEEEAGLEGEAAEIEVVAEGKEVEAGVVGGEGDDV